MTSSEAETDFRPQPSRNAEAGFVKRVLALMMEMAGGLLHSTTKKGLLKGQKHEDSQSESPGRGSPERPA